MRQRGGSGLWPLPYPLNDLTYIINFQNNGPSIADTVTVTDAIPANTIFISADVPAGWSRTDSVPPEGTGTIVFAKSSVISSETATFTIVVNVNLATASGTIISNTAFAASATPDSTPGNNTGTATTTVVRSLSLMVNDLGDAPDLALDGVCDTNVAAGNQCTLRAAIQETNAASTDDVITFDQLLNGSTITLDNALPNIDGNLQISGPQGSLVTVMRSAAGGTPNFRIFTINNGMIVFISGLTISGGAAGGGGAISNEGGMLIISDCIISGNTATAGGAIRNLGTLTVNNSTISGNTAAGAGGIYNNVLSGNAASPATITINDSTVSGNNSSGGAAGIANGVGGGGISTVTINNSTISGNTSNDNIGAGAGGISNSAVFGSPTEPSIATVTINNSTVSGNSANGTGLGGGIYNISSSGDANATVTITNSTVTDNNAGGNSGSSGGIYTSSFNSVSTVTLRNTIVARNLRNSGTADGDISGTVDAASSFNLIGIGGAGGLTDGINNNQVGVIDPRLGSLANNGGPTATHALLAGSTALDAGSNTLSDAAVLTTDQRGTGFLRKRDAADADTTQTVDIGAFEADPSVEDILNRSSAEDTSLSFSFNVGDAATAFDSITATSSNTTLLPNLPANLNVTGSGSTRTLNITTAANESGATTITVTVTKTISGTAVSMSDTFVLIVTSLNDDPTTTGIPNVSVNEDAPNTVINLTSFFNDIEDGPAGLTYTVQNNTNPALFTSTNINAGMLTLDYAPNAFGMANITIRATDTQFRFVDSTFMVTVAAVNDPPTANPQLVATNEDTPIAITLTGSDVETPPASLIFTVTGGPTNGVLSGTAPNLTYTPNLNHNGPDSFTFKVNDGTTDSADATVSITIVAVNDPPSFTKGPDQSVGEDAGSQSVPNWATNLSVGPLDESIQTLTFLVTNNTNSALFSVQPGISSTGTLSYTPAANANGVATITITLMDNGGGQNTSPPQTFTITVNAVNDAPVAVNDTYSTPENTQLNVATPGVLTNDTDAENNSLTAILVSGPSHASAFALSANGSFDYTPTAGFSGTDTFTYKANDGTVDSNTATVTITVNDGGTLQFSATTYSVSENAGPATITISRTGGSAGTATVLFSTSNGTATAADYTSVSQTVTFNDGETTKTANVPITDDPLNEPDETVNLTLGSAGGTGQPGAPSTAVLTILNDDAAGGIIKFSSASYNTTESSGSTTITVERTGDTSQAATVDYVSVDGSPSSPCSTVNGIASQRCDYTLAVGTLQFAAGETSKTFAVLLTQDSYVEGPEDLTLTLSNLTGGAVLATPSTATLTIADDLTEPATNVIDDATDFVHQHYQDFLNREPDASGLAYWTSEITKCGNDARCIHDRRIDVSAAFFVESEFQQTAYFVYRMYLASYGRRPTYAELMADRQLIDFANLAQSKQQFADAWVQRMAFTDFYDPSLSNAAFVNLLFDTAGLPGHAAERQQQIDAMNAGKTRADVVRDLVETTEFYNREFNGAFVATQYFGYLRRDPDQAGYLFWLNVLNNGVPNNFRAMVCAFLTSAEYQSRFGSATTRTNSDCAP